MPKATFPTVQMHRTRLTALSPDRARAASVSSHGAGRVAAPPSHALAGTSMRIVTAGGPVLNYEFTSSNGLTLREGNGLPVSSCYGAIEQQHMVVFSHKIPDSARGYTVVIDRNTRRATVFESPVDGEGASSGVDDRLQVLDSPREAQRQVYFGHIAPSAPCEPRQRRQARLFRAQPVCWRRQGSAR
jgi:hypothetical protein